MLIRAQRDRVPSEESRPASEPALLHALAQAREVLHIKGAAQNWWLPHAFLDDNTFVYAAETTFDPQPGRTTGTVRPAPTATLPAPPAIGPEPIEGANKGALVAWDPVAQQMRWRVAGGGGIGGGTVTTAGNLVFQVLQDGRLRAYSADKGDKLLEIDTGLRSGMGPPITYRIDGRQYVAVMGGVGNVTGNAGPGNTATTFNPKLMTFALGGSAPTTTTR